MSNRQSRGHLIPANYCIVSTAKPSDRSMKVISVNVGLPRLLLWQGSTFESGIFKNPVEGIVMLHTTNLDGDRQADLTVHGGPNKAAYAYPSEHYPLWRSELWRSELQQSNLPWGSFGENFTTQGMSEAEVFIGDRYRIGSAVVRVTTPRLPCFKLAAKFKREDIIRRFVQNGRCGFYFSVVEEGGVAADNEITLLGRDTPTLSVAEVNRLYTSAAPDRVLLQRSLDVQSLPQSWRDRFRARLEETKSHTL